MNNKSMNLLAFDMGASNGRAILGRYDGKSINVLGLFSEIKTGLYKAKKITDSNLRSAGVDTWGVDYGLLDKNGQLLSNPYHYRDSRTDHIMEEVFYQVSKEEIYLNTGIQFIQLNTLYQLYADKKYRPWILDNASTLLFMPE